MLESAPSQFSAVARKVDNLLLTPMTPNRHHQRYQKKRYRGAVFFPSILLKWLNHRLSITANTSTDVSFDPATNIRGRVVPRTGGRRLVLGGIDHQPTFAGGRWEIMIP